VTKIIGLNPVVYAKSKANLFDFLIVVVSLFEVPRNHNLMSTVT